MNRTISYRLLHILKKGKKRLGKGALERVIGFVKSQQVNEAPFRNKNGQPDLYYTVFGWSLSYVLGIRQDLQKMTAYLDSLPVSEFDLIHAAAYMRCRMILQLRKKGLPGILFSRPQECPDIRQGFPNNDPCSPYSQFISLSMREDCMQPIRERDAILNTMARYRISSGGYANRENGTSATTNATVAALAVYRQLKRYDSYDNVIYLRHIQDASGGFRATARSPVPDLLSTATALFMLKCYGVMPAYNTAGRFIEAHWLDNGGFAATLLDDSGDVEYTFYGLLALGSL